MERREPFKTLSEVDEYLGKEEIQCLECGRRLRTMGSHLERTHGMTKDDYRRIYGIPLTFGLVPKSVAEDMAARVSARNQADPVAAAMRVEKMLKTIKERPKRTNNYKWSPALMEQRKRVAAKAIASENHVSKLVGIELEAECARCSAVFKSCAIAVTTKGRLILCDNCSRKHGAAASSTWKQNNPERMRAYFEAYRDMQRGNPDAMEAFRAAYPVVRGKPR